ncbi:HNH endonuclease signature motif containing protein [Mycobacterium angelicum]|uniref:DUF222 domain-containing protein n=1 Tax=Mycobacterium angelicum TaxID=470074 RepID=A0A1W9ZD81_MYCAN|nr:HNH endonuclease signature motif containing protein [Mycobacterium angelicum]MCV7196816.1 HNH endonuclease [Mycobacterium angelicum]ORA11797.1 hypothetical protein BST12_25555 [Mycobacterium angelicum]
MGSSTREEIVEVVDALDYALDRLCGLTFDVLTTPERLRALERLERVARRLPVPGHTLINQIGAQSCEEELGGTLRVALADRLHITRAEAGRRIAEATDLGERRALTGEPLGPLLTATAQAQRDGLIGEGHVKVIRDFLRELPAAIDLGTRAAAETQLAQLATSRRPDDLAGLAKQLMDWLNPDGNYSDEDRARKRGLSLGKQEHDGMSRLSGYVDPELRATLEAVEAKLAAPGMCNRDDETPVVDGQAAPEAARHDLRSKAQRFHDGLLAGLRALLMSGKLGQHNGLPASIIVTTRLKDLEAAAGRGLTGGGTILPMSDVIRLGRQANHYLAVFDDGRPLALYHTKRLASPAQRIVLYAKERGCTAPGCEVKGYYCEVHHCSPYAQCRTTDVNELTFACGGHHPLAEKGWTTRKDSHGDTEWIPPPHLDHGQPRTNSFHHPEKLLADEDDP